MSDLSIDFELTEDNKKAIEHLLKSNGLRKYVIKLKNGELLDLVEYKDYKKLIDGINNLNEYIKQEMLLDFYSNELPLEIIIEKLLKKIQEFNNEDS